MKTAQELRPGNVIKVDNKLFLVQKQIFNQGGRNASTVKLKLQNLDNKTLSEPVYKASEKFDNIQLDRKQMQFLFKSGDMYTFMNQETYEQIEISEEFLGDNAKYLKEEMIIDVILYEERPISIELPIVLEYDITYTENAVKGDTSGKILKTAMLDAGFEIQVPAYCVIGNRIRIDTRTGEFMERAK
jgi:elongation factor P